MNQQDDTNEIAERCSKDERRAFTIMWNDITEDTLISPEARWLMLYLLGRPEGWRIIPRDIENKSGWGRDKRRRVYKELCNRGYMLKEQYQQNGLNRIRYLYSDRPKFKSILPETGFQAPDFQAPENPSPYQLRRRENTELRKPLPPPKGGAYVSSSKRRGLRANGENPRAVKAALQTAWANKVVEQLASQGRKHDVEIMIAEGKEGVLRLCVLKYGHPACGFWYLPEIDESTRDQVITALRRMGMHATLDLAKVPHLYPIGVSNVDLSTAK